MQKGTLDAILQLASNAAADRSSGTQGQAEFDTLERVVKSLGDITGASKTGDWHAMNPNPAGGTWAERSDLDGYTGRDVIHKNLEAIAQKIGDASALAGQMRVDPDHDAGAARRDFAALLSLTSGATFSLRLIDPSPNSAGTAALASANAEQYQQWLADGNALVQNADRAKLKDRRAHV